MLDKLSAKKYLLMICITAIVLLFGGYHLFIKKEANTNEYVVPVELEESLEEEVIMNEKEQVIFIDVKGSVKREGVYEAKLGQRVKDIIDLAGGFTSEADTRQVNLAKMIEDEMVIYVPKIGEELTNSMNDPSDGKISINKATINEFVTLPGIGPAKAEAIISYREEHGPFTKLEDLLQISGIGQKTFDKIKDELKLN